MAPELFNGARVDEAADVYSLGCILYECVARKRPFGELLGDDARSFNMLFKVSTSTLAGTALAPRQALLQASHKLALAALLVLLRML
jgi:serine/threonine protein kinase